MRDIDEMLRMIFDIVERGNVFKIVDNQFNKEFRIGELVFLKEKCNNKIQIIIRDNLNAGKSIVIYDGDSFSKNILVTQKLFVENYLIELLDYLKKLEI